MSVSICAPVHMTMEGQDNWQLKILLFPYEAMVFNYIVKFELFNCVISCLFL